MKLSTIPILLLLAPVASAQGWNTGLEMFGEAAGDWFGERVSQGPDLTGDGVPELLIGAANADGLVGTDVGKAYILNGVDGSMIFTPWEGQEVYDHLGSRICAVGDVNGDGFTDIAVSASGHLGYRTYGKIHVYSGYDATELLQIQGFGSHEYLGTGLCGVGDVNGDGYDDIVAGTQGTPSQGSPGYFAIYSGLDGSEIWKRSGQVTGTNFGFAVAPIADLDGDGITDLIVSEHDADTNGTDTGTVYLFSGVDGHPLDELSGTEVGGRLGIEVESAGDVNGDGIADVIASAQYSDPGGRVNAGSVYVFSGANLSNTLLHLEGPVSNDYMGWGVAGGVDWNADGIPDVACGAPGTTHEWSSALGAAYVFSGKDGDLLQTFQGTDPGGFFGGGVAALDDVSGDGSADLLVTTRFADTVVGVDAGQVTVFESPGTFDFTVQGLSPGQPATLSASGCRPNSTVYPVYSLVGEGSTWTNYGFALSILNPVRSLPPIVTSVVGSGYQVVYVPTYAPPGLTILWQAVERSWNGAQNEFRVANVLETVVL